MTVSKQLVPRVLLLTVLLPVGVIKALDCFPLSDTRVVKGWTGLQLKLLIRAGGVDGGCVAHAMAEATTVDRAALLKAIEEREHYKKLLLISVRTQE